MNSAALTFPPATARLVVDTDVASFIFKWHPEFATQYVEIPRGFDLILSFMTLQDMTLAEMRHGALNANWGLRKRDVLEAYLGDFSVLHSDGLLRSTWALIRDESAVLLSAPLVTKNPKDYRHLDGLRVVSASAG